MKRAWVYPEREWQPLGAVRYQLSWEELTPEAEKKVGTDHDYDYDADIAHCYLTFSDEQAAIRKGKELVESGKTCFGAASVVKQVVDWFVEEDRVAEWRDAGEPEEVTA